MVVAYIQQPRETVAFLQEGAVVGSPAIHDRQQQPVRYLRREISRYADYDLLKRTLNEYYWKDLNADGRKHA